jgi:hypothetical protein
MNDIFSDDKDFTARDFEAIDARLQSLQESVFPDIDADQDAYLTLLRKKISWGTSRNDFYLTRIKREAFVATMRERRSAIYQGRRQSYKLSGANAATADLSVELLNGPLDGDITFQVGDVVKTDEVPVATVGEIQTEVILPAGSTTAQLSWEHSQTKSVSFQSNGNANQNFFLAETPYLDGTTTIETISGEWTEVDNFLLSGPTDRHFVIIVDQNDNATIYTGDNKKGAIPEGTMTVGYKTGGGLEGNVSANSLIRFGKSYTDSLGNSAILSVTNNNSLNDGEARETVDEARVNIPNNRRLPTTTVAQEDFVIRALTVGGVGRALMLAAPSDSSIPENEGRLYIVPELGGEPTQALLDEVQTLVTETKPGPVTFTNFTLGAVYLTVDVYAVVYLNSGASATTVKAAIVSSLEHFFEPIVSEGSQVIGEVVETNSGIEIPISKGMPNPLVDFGFNYKDEDGNPAGEIAYSDIYNAVRDTVGVRKIGASEDDFTLNGVSSDVFIYNHQFPALGTVTIINGKTGTEI